MNHDTAKARQDRNQAILERMKNPKDSLKAYDADDTFYPVRGIFDKRLGKMVKFETEESVTEESSWTKIQKARLTLVKE